MNYRTLGWPVRHRSPRAFAAYLALMFPLSVACAYAGTSLNAASLSAEIKANGAGTVFAELSQGDKWDEFLKNVETGHAQWLQIAVQLGPASDQAASTLLTVAAGVALAKAASQVLSILVPTFPVEEVCGLPDVSDLRFATKAKASRYLDARVAAVTRLTQPTIADRKSACLKALEQAKQIIAAPDGPFP